MKKLLLAVVMLGMAGGAYAENAAWEGLIKAAGGNVALRAVSGSIISKAAPVIRADATEGSVKSATLISLIPLLVEGKPKVYTADRYPELLKNFSASEYKFQDDQSNQGKFNYLNATLLRMQIERCQDLGLSKCSMLWQGDKKATLSMLGSDAWVTAAHVIDGFIKDKALKRQPGGKILLQSLAVIEVGDSGTWVRVDRLFLPKTATDPGSAETASVRTGRDTGGKKIINIGDTSMTLEVTDFAVISFDANAARRQIAAVAAVTPVADDLLTIALDDGELRIPAGIVMPVPGLEASGLNAWIGITQSAGAKRTIVPGDSGRAVKDASGRFAGVIVAGQKSATGIVFILSFDAAALVP